MNLRYSITTAAILTLGGFCACATPEPKSPTTGLTSAATPPVLRAPPPAPARIVIEGPYNLAIGESIISVCSGPDPYFAFDSTKPSLDDQPTMKNLVACMKDGALHGKTIRLIGHTDPRGTPGYNELGFERADKVKGFLVANGIESQRIEVTSVGGEEASPRTSQWPTDRRVEIVLATDTP